MTIKEINQAMKILTKSNFNGSFKLELFADEYSKEFLDFFSSYNMPIDIMEFKDTILDNNYWTIGYNMIIYMYSIPKWNSKLNGFCQKEIISCDFEHKVWHCKLSDFMKIITYIPQKERKEYIEYSRMFVNYLDYESRLL